MYFGRGWGYYGRQIGAYQIIGRVGAGRYGICFMAEKDGATVILKRLKPRALKGDHGDNPKEAQILSGLCHPGIPKLLEVVAVTGFNGLALEHKDGETIETMLFKHKHHFTEREICNIGAQLIGIIRYLHEKGVVHRDIRIPNMLLDGAALSLIDFGLAGWEDNASYRKGSDFSYLGDLLLYLLYSSYRKGKGKSRPWYEELPLTPAQRLFLKRLLRMETPYPDIDAVAQDFQRAFGAGISEKAIDSRGCIIVGS